MVPGHARRSRDIPGEAWSTRRGLVHDAQGGISSRKDAPGAHTGKRVVATHAGPRGWGMDAELVIRAQHGDEAAFASLAVAIGDRLHAVAQRILRDVELAIPGDVDPATCDEEQYRLWAEHDGTPRLAYPGERIQLATIDFEPGLLVVDTSWRQEASMVERGQAQAARDSLWIGLAREPTASP